MFADQDSDEADPEDPIRARLREVLKQLHDKVGPFLPFDFNTKCTNTGFLFAWHKRCLFVEEDDTKSIQLDLEPEIVN